MNVNGNELHELDTLSQQTLTALYKRGRANTAELRQMIGREGDELGRKIRYRMDRKLIPNGVAKEVGREEYSGNDVRVYQMTRDGQRAVEQEWERLDNYLQRNEVMDAQRETRNRLDLLHDIHDETRTRQDNVEDDFDELESDFRGLEGNFAELRQRVEELESELEEEREKRKRLESELEDVDETLGLIEKQIDETKRIAEEAWAFVNSISKKIARQEYGEIEPLESLEPGRSLNTMMLNNEPSKRREWGGEADPAINADEEWTFGDD